MFREIKIADAALKNPETLRWNVLNKRFALITSQTKPGEQDDDDLDDAVADQDNASGQGEKTSLPDTTTKNNPVLVAIYGQICVAAKSYQSAICASPPCPFDPWNSSFHPKFICCTHTIIAPMTPWFVSVSR